MSDLMHGFKAAVRGDHRDARRSEEWLEGYDGYAIGKAQNEAARAEHMEHMSSPEYVAARKKLKAKLRRRCHSSTPVTL